MFLKCMLALQFHTKRQINLKLRLSASGKSLKLYLNNDKAGQEKM